MSDPDDIDLEFYEIVGRMASDWAHLEMQVNDCIWALAGTPYGAGACITAQIYTFDGRMKALVALLRLRSVSNDFIRRVNVFHEGCRAAAQKRNRAVHDSWGSRSGDAVQLVVSADKLLRFELAPKSVADLREDHIEIEQKNIDFQIIKNELEVILQTLPDTRQLVIQASFHAHSQMRKQSIQTQSPDGPPQSSEG